jgi:hypothetical protein
MKTLLAGSSAVVLACSVVISLGAQALQSSVTPSELVTTMTTVMGCIQPGTTTERFVLASTNVVPEPKGGPPGVVTGPMTRVVRYDLVVEDNVDLAKLVGHWVEATGRVLVPERKPAAEPSVSDTRTGAGREVIETPISFRALSVRDVAPIC